MNSHSLIKQSLYLLSMPQLTAGRRALRPPWPWSGGPGESISCAVVTGSGRRTRLGGVVLVLTVHDEVR